MIPGGSWQRSRRWTFAALNAYLASRGCSVAVVEYRTAPEFLFPAALEDVRQALAYLKENAGNLGVDPERLVLLGRSAGAQLALLEAYAGGNESIRGVVLPLRTDRPALRLRSPGRSEGRERTASAGGLTLAAAPTKRGSLQRRPPPSISRVPALLPPPCSSRLSATRWCSSSKANASLID